MFAFPLHFVSDCTKCIVGCIDLVQYDLAGNFEDAFTCDDQYQYEFDAQGTQMEVYRKISYIVFRCWRKSNGWFCFPSGECPKR